MYAGRPIPVIPNYDNLILINAGPEGDTFISDKSIVKVFHFTGDTYEDNDFIKICEISKFLSDKIPLYVPLIYEIYTNSNFVALIMEHVDSVTLGEFIRNKADVALKDIATVVVSLCNAIGNIHKMGYVHSDFHRGNILVTRDFKVKIIDFSCSDVISSVDPGDGLTPRIYTDYCLLLHHLADLIFNNFPNCCAAGALKIIPTLKVNNVIGYDDDPVLASKLFHMIDPLKNLDWDTIFKDG